jgi:CrcB protein
VDTFLSMLAVTAGGSLGAVTRFWLSGVIGRRVGETFPWGTLAVNVSGAAAIGALAAALPAPDSGVLASLAWLALAAGFLGGYTTVSSFSLQCMSLMRGGEGFSAVSNVVASVGLCLMASSAGFAVATLAAS